MARGLEIHVIGLMLFSSRCQKESVTIVNCKSIGGKRDDHQKCTKNDRQKAAGFLRKRYSAFGILRGVLGLGGGAASRYACPKERPSSSASSSWDIQDR